MLKTLPELIAQARENVTCITANEAVKKCKALNGVFIDVREPAEFANQSATGAINIPRGVLEPQILEKITDAQKPIFIHCATGGRATLAAEQLLRVGYENVWAITCKFDDVFKAHQTEN
ncbi:rhodanese-like domain-containing protein [Thalassotalea sediminis]|uniref:rhodanese-like domain-containing protein n=1 Tax=Thalassotalea sediminis TaxID=1759089 RepID=UPI0025728A2E|nr:rhodanese-like domain-containing protein [Thalassotalea sediminis]